ncbi:uncharacterized protein BJ171DRAFT_584215 [Polychytrium aggregatum]|uniref:uncharacterized protein n=1 Tax=Polychytrium aggregatum TaxID=110093 RepID=UPI0022FF3475|nr:uncharacterized protein BJ171DRAFT_584215 [Polychytrium aggregatum]KAI9202307.1 hypothetical protein BJ171DRAFT_584215 [Polychytrium aggregatum]
MNFYMPSSKPQSPSGSPSNTAEILGALVQMIAEKQNIEPLEFVGCLLRSPSLMAPSASQSPQPMTASPELSSSSSSSSCLPLLSNSLIAQSLANQLTQAAAASLPPPAWMGDSILPVSSDPSTQIFPDMSDSESLQLLNFPSFALEMCNSCSVDQSAAFSFDSSPIQSLGCDCSAMDSLTPPISPISSDLDLSYFTPDSLCESSDCHGHGNFLFDTPLASPSSSIDSITSFQTVSGPLGASVDAFAPAGISPSTISMDLPVDSLGGLMTPISSHSGSPAMSCPVAIPKNSMPAKMPTPSRMSCTCTIDGCGKVFTRRYNLISHVRSTHCRERPFSCLYCPSAFARRHDLRRHLQSMHKSSPEEASEIAGNVEPSSPKHSIDPELYGGKRRCPSTVPRKVKRPSSE